MGDLVGVVDRDHLTGREVHLRAAGRWLALRQRRAHLRRLLQRRRHLLLWCGKRGNRRRLVGVVLDHVLLERGGLLKCRAALVALEWLFAGVNHLVLEQVLAPVERLGAHAALVLLLLGVQALVALEVAGVMEGLRTYRAHVRLGRAVRPLMAAAVGRLVKPLLTVLALKWLVPCVNSVVHLERAAVGESLRADLTLVGLLSRMQHLMPLEVTDLCKPFTTRRAHMRLLTAVFAKMLLEAADELKRHVAHATHNQLAVAEVTPLVPLKHIVIMKLFLTLLADQLLARVDRAHVLLEVIFAEERAVACVALVYAPLPGGRIDLLREVFSSYSWRPDDGQQHASITHLTVRVSLYLTKL